MSGGGLSVHGVPPSGRSTGTGALRTPRIRGRNGPGRTKFSNVNTDVGFEARAACLVTFELTRSSGWRRATPDQGLARSFCGPAEERGGVCGDRSCPGSAAAGPLARPAPLRARSPSAECGVRSSANAEQPTAGSMPGTHPQGRSRAGECVSVEVKAFGHDGPVVADAREPDRTARRHGMAVGARRRGQRRVRAGASAGSGRPAAHRHGAPSTTSSAPPAPTFRMPVQVPHGLTCDHSSTRLCVRQWTASSEV